MKINSLLRRYVLKKIGWFFVVFLLSVGITNASPILITNSSDAALTGSTVIDFNSESLSTFTSQTFNSDVTFSVSSGSLYIENTYSGEFGSSGNYLANQTNPNPITINFVQDVSAFGFSWGAADEPWTMALYNSSSGLLGTLNIAAQTAPYIGFIGGTDSTDSISYAVLTDQSSYGYDYFLLDNFEYVTASPSAPIPDPATFLLFGLGLLGVAGVSRKKK